MKKIILTTLFFAPAVLLAQQVNYAIKGNVGTSDAPAKAYLTYRSDTGNITDSTSVQQGNFSFKGTIAIVGVRWAIPIVGVFCPFRAF